MEFCAVGVDADDVDVVVAGEPFVVSEAAPFFDAVWAEVVCVEDKECGFVVDDVVDAGVVV